MQVKKSIKKVGAVAGSALMVGMTFGAAAPLADFPQPFVDDDGQVQSQIVVGSQGKVADVVGAINIGASVGQAAVQTTEETVEGSTSVDVDGFSDEATVRGALNNGSTVLMGSYDYSPLIFDSEYGADNIFVEEEVRVNRAGNHVNTTVVNGTEVLTTVDAGAVEYSVDYGSGANVSEEIAILGDSYTITAMDSSASTPWVEMGSTETRSGLELGDTYDHPSSPYTVEVVDKDESSSAIYVEVSKDGEVLKAKGLSTDGSNSLDSYVEVDDGDFRVDADRVFFGSKRDYIDVTSTYTDTRVENGEASPFDEDYTATLDWNGDLLAGLTLQNDLRATTSPAADDDTEIQALSEGDTFAGPADYFDVSYADLEEPDTEKLTFKKGHVVSYTDALGNTNSVNMSQVVDASNNVTSGAVTGVDRKGLNYPLDVSYTDMMGDITLSYGDYERTVTANASGITVGPLTVSVFEDGGNIHVLNGEVTESEYDGTLSEATADTLHTNFEAALDDADNDGNVTVTEDNGDTFTVGYVGTSVNDATEANGVWTASGEDDEAMSTFGSLVSVGSEGEQISVSYPESQVNAHLTVGDSESTSTEGGTYQTIDEAAQGSLPSMAMLDSDVQESHKTNNHLILVGGPAVNTLVADLVDAGSVDLSDLEGQGSGALVQGVSDAFAEGQDALVVAGVNADDTRSASQYVANYASHESALSDAGDRLVLAEADYPSEQ